MTIKRKIFRDSEGHRESVKTWLSFASSAFFVIVALLSNNNLIKVSCILVAVLVFGVFARRFAGIRRNEMTLMNDKSARNVLCNTIESIIFHEPEPAFLTDPEGHIQFQNAAADQKFKKTEDGHLISIFGQMLAAPEPLLFKLQTRVSSIGSGSEDFRIQDGQYSLSVISVGSDLYVWRLSKKISNDREKSRATDQLVIPMLTVGPSDAVLYMNDAFRNLVKSRPRSLQSIFVPVPRENGEICSISTGEKNIEVLVSIIDRNAGRREIYLLPAPDQSNNVSHPKAVNGIWEAIEDLPVPLLKVDADGVITASNKEARSLFEIDSTEGLKFDELLDGLGRPIEDWLKEAILGKGGHASQFLRGRGSHHETYIQVTLNLSNGAEGRHLIAVLNDVTEFKTLEARFVQSQKMQAIGQLAGGVAHDFNNLLTAISGHCDLLLLRHSKGDPDFSDLDQIHQNAKRAAGLVRQLLAFSRKQNLQPEIIDLRDTLSELTQLLNRLVSEKIKLSFSHGENLNTIKADKRQLEQVLMNLVVNARDAMPNGGRISVQTKNLFLEKEYVKDRAVVPPGEYVELRVVDNGTGIKAERLPKIFEPFYTTKRLGEGTGLGLSTVYGIVKQTGGYIFVESEIGKGSTFQILLPAHQKPKPNEITPQRQPEAKHAPSGDGVVLLVEDEFPVRAFASRALRMKGYTVLEADCAETALDMLADPELDVDIFVTDVIMPGKDGPTWVKEALVSRPDTKVVFVSGYAEDAFGGDGNQIPNSVFLPKPFSLTQLASTIKQQLH